MQCNVHDITQLVLRLQIGMSVEVVEVIAWSIDPDDFKNIVTLEKVPTLE